MTSLRTTTAPTQAGQRGGTRGDTVRRDGPAYAQVPEWVLFHPDLDGNAVRLYCVLDRYAGQAEECWPGRRALAEQLGCSKDTIDRGLKKLVAASAVTVTERWDAAGDQTSNAYTVHFIGPEGVAARVQGGGRKSAATGGQNSGGGGRNDAATGGRKSAALSIPSLNEVPPNPPPAGGDTDATNPDTNDEPGPGIDRRASCARHPAGRGKNCRGCGTTNRQVEAAAAADRARHRRDADAEATARDRADRQAALAGGRSPTTVALLDRTRAQLAEHTATIATGRTS